MDINDVKDIFLKLRGSKETYPFGPDVMVFKVGNKMFGLMNSHEERPSINIKNEPVVNEMLRMEYLDTIIPGYHMNKKHWNTIYIEEIDDETTIDLINQSYLIVYDSLTKKEKEMVNIDE
ncbi:MAG: MmcQ/YjbR family DNA-binding protein [Bacillota bacterium]|nr:MmcQ/YjbR family DNA-binding protein [Bacillota bacterium]